MEYSKSDIRKFHNYELPEEKLELFEQEIKNESMNESIENYKMSEQLSAELYTPGYLDLLNEKKKTFLNNLPQGEKKRNLFIINRFVLGIAASICLVVASMLVFQTDESSHSISKVASQAAMASLNLDHLATIERGDNEVVKNPIVELYKNGQYAKVVEEVSIEESSKMLQLLEARSLLHLNDYEGAVSLLQKLNTHDFPQRDALLWSLVEVELQLENNGNVRKYLSEIIDNKYPNYKTAQKIMQNI